jgi:hypothetical protein
MTTNVEREVIVEVGAEGGSIALCGVRGEAGWSYSLYVNHRLLDEEPIQKETDQVETWDAAIALLDRYPWRQLSPLRVHPEFRSKILSAVGGDSAPHRRRLKNWEAVCKGGAVDKVRAR